MLDIRDRIVPPSLVNTLRAPIEQLAASPSAGLALLITLVILLLVTAEALMLVLSGPAPRRSAAPSDWVTWP